MGKEIFPQFLRAISTTRVLIHLSNSVLRMAHFFLDNWKKHNMKTQLQLIKLAFVIAVLLAIIFSAYSSFAQNKLTWDKIGTETVDYTIDHDVVSLHKSQQIYTALKIKVINGTLNVHKATVHYVNGDKQDFELPAVLGEGNDGKLIDLVGNKRLIEKVTFWYDTENKNNEKAMIEVWARK